MKKSKAKASVNNNMVNKNPNEDFTHRKDITKSVDGNIQINKTKQSLFPSNTSDLETVSKDDDHCVTPKAQGLCSSDVRRWASVVKAKKKLLTTEFGTRFESDDITPEIFDCVFQTFPKNFEAHKGFITCNQSMFFCNVCHVELDSVLNLSNHLKTRNHENSIISFLKQNIPKTLHHILEFVSFYGSNMCCNLCRCKIDLSSYNPFETIVNIMAHNTDTVHANHKTSLETENEADTLIKSLALTIPEIKESLCFIEKKMRPWFKCQLCEKNILYNEKLSIIAQNFVSHLKSTCHLKNQRAVETLKQFEEESITGTDTFTVVNGNISCNYCSQNMEINVEKLISHVNGVEHAKNVLEKVSLSQCITTKNSEIKEEGSVKEEDMRNEGILVADTTMEVEEKECSKQTNVKKCKQKLNDDLMSFADLKQINYLIENGKGSVTCLLCNRIIPPSVQNIQTHLHGSNHKKNEMIKQVEGTSNESFKSTKKQASETRNLDSLKSLLSEKPKFQKMQKGLKNVLDSNITVDISKVACLICQYKKPQSCFSCKQPQEFCLHHLDKISCLLKCPDSSPIDAVFLLEKKILHVFRNSNSLEQQILLPCTRNEIYNRILAKNCLVAENKDFLVTNVDLLHVYCKLCRALIRVSMDLDIFENNLVRHLKFKVHMVNFSTQKHGSFNSTEYNSSINIRKSLNNSQSTGKEDGRIKEYNPSFETDEKECKQSLFQASVISSLITQELTFSEHSELNSFLLNPVTGKDDDGALIHVETDQRTLLPSGESGCLQTSAWLKESLQP